MAIALIPALAIVGSPSQVRYPALLGVLVALCWLAEAAEIKLTTGNGLDATTAIALVVLVLNGPLIAFGVMMSAIIVVSQLRRLPGSKVERAKLIREGNLVAFGAYGWSLLAASAVLTLGPPNLSARSAPTILLAGMLASWAQAALGPCLHEPLYNGIRLREFLAAARRAVPVDVAMLAIASLTTVFIVDVGGWTVVLLAATVCLPTLVPAAAKARPANELSALALTERYASALATFARLSAHERRRLRLVLKELADPHLSTLRRELATNRFIPLDEQKDLLRTAHLDAYAVWMVEEPWSEADPARCDRIPLLARIAAVAVCWAELTARGGPELSADEALLELQAQAGVRLDPAVVNAARLIVMREQRFTQAAVTCAALMRVVVDAHQAVAGRAPALQPSLLRVWIASRVSLNAGGLGALRYAAIGSAA